MLWCQGAQNTGPNCAKVQRMITTHAHPSKTNIMAIARRFVLMNASHSKNKMLKIMCFNTRAVPMYIVSQ